MRLVSFMMLVKDRPGLRQRRRHGLASFETCSGAPELRARGLRQAARSAAVPREGAQVEVMSADVGFMGLTNFAKSDAVQFQTARHRTSRTKLFKSQLLSNLVSFFSPRGLEVASGFNFSSLKFLKSWIFHVIDSQSAFRHCRFSRKMTGDFQGALKDIFSRTGQIFQAHPSAVIHHAFSLSCLFQVHSRAGHFGQQVWGQGFGGSAVEVRGGSVVRIRRLGCRVLSLFVLLLLSGSGSPTRDDDGDDNDDAREATDDGGSVVHRDVWSLGVWGGRLVSLCCCRCLWLIVVVGIGTPAGDDDGGDHNNDVRRQQRQRQRQTSSDDSRARAPLD